MPRSGSPKHEADHTPAPAASLATTVISPSGMAAVNARGSARARPWCHPAGIAQFVAERGQQGGVGAGDLAAGPVEDDRA
ncbi:MAG: hypothetical protein M3Y33_06605 [Actinomycetota bacterium]|nr:hypothetical protein [Actinomycetota bacterium]